MQLEKIIDSKDLLDFSQNFSIARPDFLGDTLFPDRKTENLEAEYYMNSDTSAVPTMAKVHGFDTEAAIGQRPVFEKVSIEKLFIKEKINLSERVRLLLGRGVSQSAIIDYVYDDMARLADAVKTRTEVMKMELASSGTISIKENNIDNVIDYQISADQKYSLSWTTSAADILGDIDTMVSEAKARGKVLTHGVTSSKIFNLLKQNVAIQKGIYGENGTGRFISDSQIIALMQDLFGLVLYVNDGQYKYLKADGTYGQARFFPENKISLFTGSGLGLGLWGVTPEEAVAGPYSEKSQKQFITLTKWETADPVATWTKASGVFVPTLQDIYGVSIATVAFA